jgi:small GTP-binding protein
MLQETFFKVLIVGSTKSGKSSLINYSADSRFDETYTPTIGADFSTKAIGDIRIQFWDLAGPKRFQNMSKVYFDNSKACILVIDNTNIETFDTAGWRECIRNWERRNGSKQIEVFLIALNKIDLEEGAVIQGEDLKNTPLEWAIDYEIPVVKTSAKTGQGVKDLFALLTNMLIEKESISQEPQPVNEDNILYIPRSWNSETREKLQLSEKIEALNIEQTKQHLNEQAIKNLHENIGRYNKIKTFERSSPLDKGVRGNDDESKSKLSKETIKENVRESNAKQSASSISRAGFREQTIEHYCPPSESEKIKNIPELNFNLLLEIIRENKAEEKKLKPDELTQYFIAYNIFNRFNMEMDSIRCLDKIISIAEESGSLAWKSYALNEYAEIFKDKEEYDAAIDYYKNALEIDRELNDPESIANDLHNIASLHYNQENYSKALKFFQEALKIDKDLNILSNQANRQWWIGSVFSKINKTQSALTYLKKALRLYNKLGYSEEAKEIQSFINNIDTVQNKQL